MGDLSVGEKNGESLTPWDGPLFALEPPSHPCGIPDSNQLQAFSRALVDHYRIDWKRFLEKSALSEKVSQIIGGVSAGLCAVIEHREASGERWSLETWGVVGIKIPVRIAEILAQGIAGLLGTGLYLFDVIPTGQQELNRQILAGEAIDLGKFFGASKYVGDARLTVHSLATLAKAAGIASLWTLPILDLRPHYHWLVDNPERKNFAQIQAERRAKDHRFFAEDLFGLDLNDPFNPNRLSDALALGLSFAVGPKLMRVKTPAVGATPIVEAGALKYPPQLKVIGGTGFGPKRIAGWANPGGVVPFPPGRALPPSASGSALGTVARAGEGFPSGDMAPAISLQQYLEGNAALAPEFAPARPAISPLPSPGPKLSLVEPAPAPTLPGRIPSLPILAIPAGEPDPFTTYQENQIRHRHQINIETLKVIERLYGYPAGRLSEAYLQAHGLVKKDLSAGVGKGVTRASQGDGKNDDPTGAEGKISKDKLESLLKKIRASKTDLEERLSALSKLADYFPALTEGAEIEGVLKTLQGLVRNPGLPKPKISPPWARKKGLSQSPPPEVLRFYQEDRLLRRLAAEGLLRLLEHFPLKDPMEIRDMVFWIRRAIEDPGVPNHGLPLWGRPAWPQAHEAAEFQVRGDLLRLYLAILPSLSRPEGGEEAEAGAWMLGKDFHYNLIARALKSESRLEGEAWEYLLNLLKAFALLRRIFPILSWRSHAMNRKLVEFEGLIFGEAEHDPAALEVVGQLAFTDYSSQKFLRGLAEKGNLDAGRYLQISEEYFQKNRIWIFGSGVDLNHVLELGTGEEERGRLSLSPLQEKAGGLSIPGEDQDPEGDPD